MEEASLFYVLCSVILFHNLPRADGFEEAGKIHFTNSWAVHIENGSDVIASEIAEKHGFHNFGQIGSLPGYYQFVHREIKKRRKRREVSKTVTLLLEDKIQWVEQQHVLDRDKRSIIPDYIDVIHPNGYSIQDPLYSDQWYLNNIGQSSGPVGLDINVLPVWARGIAGRGVVVAVLDDGLDHTHPDLKTNYDPKASYDFNDYDEDPLPRSSDPNNCHGTKCAGEVGAEAGNGVCGVGVAFNSSVGGIRMLDGNVTDTIEGSALSYHKDYIDIYSCAWGPKDDGKRFGRPGTLASKALELGAKEGRNGLGSIFVWATGNGGLTDDDCNCDGYTTSVYTVSIGAISDHGLSTYYTESCASTLAVTYSGGSHREKKENKIVTTTLNHKCTDEFKGTSAAAPIAAGMIALVLETNPNVTWRDVQHLIVETSVMSSPLDEGWRRNGAGKWFNQKFGFGRMDAAAMVEKAATWSNVQEQRNCWSDKSEGPWTIPSSGTLLVAMNTTACGETASNIRAIEHVQVVISLNHRRRGHVSIELISPSGTRTQLLKTRRNDRSTKGLKDWVFMSVHFWGEDPKGTWTLAITDNNHNDREHHVETTKYGDMEDATGALQDLIEDKEENIEHEKIVEDDDLFKSAEEFENQIFKDNTYRKGKEKTKEKDKEKEKETERGKENDVVDGNDSVAEEINKVILDKYVAKEKKLEEADEESKEGEEGEGGIFHKVNKNSHTSKTKKYLGKANKSNDKTVSSNKSKSTKKVKAKKKLTAEEDAEEQIVEELLKDSTPHFQSPITSNTSKVVPLPSSPSAVPLSPAISSHSSLYPFTTPQNVSKQIQPEQTQHQYSSQSFPQSPPSVSVASSAQSFPQTPPQYFSSPPQSPILSPPASAFPQSSIPSSSSLSASPQTSSSLSSSSTQSSPQSASSVSRPSSTSFSALPLSSSPSSSSSSTSSNFSTYPSSSSSSSPSSSPSSFSSSIPSSSSSSSVQADIPQHAAPATITINVGKSNTTVQTNEAGALGMVSNHSSEENSTLEFVLRNVLTEVFANFKQEDQGYKLLANRIEGLEMALQEGKNKTRNIGGDRVQRYSTVLLNALKNGKPIDKIQKVLNVLEDSRQNNASRHNTNSSFAKNAEVVTDVLKVLKDILSTKKDDLKDDRELKVYKKRISKLLQTSSNGTRQLTEKLFNDIEPIGDGKEGSTTSSHVMNDALTLISHVFQRNKPQQNIQPIKISKDFRISLKAPSLSRTHYDDKEQLSPFRMAQSERSDYDPLSDILLHGDFVKNILAKDKGKSADNDHPSSSRNEEGKEDDSKITHEPYEKVGLAEKNGQHIFINPDDGNEQGMNQYHSNYEESRDDSRHREGKGESTISNHDSTEHFGKGEVDAILFNKEKQKWHKEKEKNGKEPPEKYDTLDRSDHDFDNRNHNNHDHDNGDHEKNGRHDGEIKRLEDHTAEGKEESRHLDGDREESNNKDSPRRCERSTPGCDHKTDFLIGHDEEKQIEKERDAFHEKEGARKYDDNKAAAEQLSESHIEERQSEADSSRRYQMLGSENKELDLDNRSDTEEHHKYLLEHNKDTPNEQGGDKKETDEDSSDFTIAIMKDGKKIGERKVDKLQATRYLVKPKIAPNLFPSSPPEISKPKIDTSFYPNSPPPSFMRESELKSEAAEPEDVLLKSAMFPNIVPLSTDSPKTQSNPSKTEDGDKSDNIVEYNKISRKPAVPLDEFQHSSKDIDFDVTKFASEENRFNEHTLDHPEKTDSGETTTSSTTTPEDKANILKDPERAELFITHKIPPSLPLNPNLPMEKPEKELRGEIEDTAKNDVFLNEAFSENTKRKDDTEQKNERKMMEKHSGIKTSGSSKKSSKWSKHGKEKHYDKDNSEEEYEHFMHFDGPMPFMQIPDPTQFAPGEVQADENENFLHPSFGAFNPNRIPTIVDLPVHTSFFDNRDVPGFELDNTEDAEEYEAMKRSDIPELAPSPRQLFNDEIYVGKGEVAIDKPERTRRSSEDDYEETDEDGEKSMSENVAQRSRQIIDNGEKMSKQKFNNSGNESDLSLNRSKRYPVEEQTGDDTDDDEEDNEGPRPHVVKRSAILSEIHPFKKISEHARFHSSVKRIKAKGVSRTGSKRSGVRKATEIESKKNSESMTSKESSSVLNIIKRVHDDIALGNSKDLRTLESELAKLEGISMSESNEQVKTFENLAKNKQRENQMTQVRARVTKTRVREKEDPDEYYKYGATASGKLESWTLHFYGTGG